MMPRRPVTRSQSTKHGLTVTTNEEPDPDAPVTAPKHKQRRHNDNQTTAKATVDQSTLDDRLEKDLNDTALVEYEIQKKQGKTQNAFQVLVWGDGSMGQLGFGEEEDDPLRIFPVELSLNKPVRSIAAGGMHTLMHMNDGTLQSFGSNDEGALGRKTVGDVWGIDTADSSDLKQWLPADVVLPDSDVSIEGIRCTDTACFVWTTNGRIYAWGSFRSSDGLIGFTDTVRIQKSPICVYIPTSPSKQTRKLSTGSNHVLALLKNGTVLSWGSGERGQLGRCHPEKTSKKELLQPTEVSAIQDKQIIDVYCGDSTSFFKTANGCILVCGLNNDGQLGIEPNLNSAEDSCPTIESSVKSKSLFLEPTVAEALSSPNIEIQSIASGKRHTLALTTEGDVYSFGSSMYGVLGRLTANESKPFPIPQKIPGLDSSSITSIAAGQDCSACIDSEGRLLRFGGEHSGLMCVGWDGEDILKPQLLVKGNAAKTFTFTHVDFGGQHGVLLGQNKKQEMKTNT